MLTELATTLDYVDIIKFFMKVLWEEKIPKEILSQAPSFGIVFKLSVDGEKVSEWVITLK